VQTLIPNTAALNAVDRTEDKEINKQQNDNLTSYFGSQVELW